MRFYFSCMNWCTNCFLLFYVIFFFYVIRSSFIGVSFKGIFLLLFFSFQCIRKLIFVWLDLFRVFQSTFEFWSTWFVYPFDLWKIFSFKFFFFFVIEKWKWEMWSHCFLRACIFWKEQKVFWVSTFEISSKRIYLIRSKPNNEYFNILFICCCGLFKFSSDNRWIWMNVEMIYFFFFYTREVSETKKKIFVFRSREATIIIPFYRWLWLASGNCEKGFIVNDKRSTSDCIN